MSEDEKIDFIVLLEEIIKIYKENITDIEWSKLSISKQFSDNISQKIFELFKTIDYQFNQSVRKKPYTGYKKWFEEFCKLNFLKRRGSLGYTLNITEEYLLFITKLCIKHKEKIKLKDLFKEYNKRGLYFDRDSQTKIVQLFEKLNLIEKKSDSGDAQYVKTIL